MSWPQHNRETSGVLLFAKDPRTARSLADAFFARQISKDYLALVQGRVSWEETELELALGREGGEIKLRQELAAVDLEALGAERQMLHAFRLSFPNPGSDGEALMLEAPLPEDMRAELARRGLRGP